jgi:hypothetical protein
MRGILQNAHWVGETWVAFAFVLAGPGRRLALWMATWDPQVRAALTRKGIR